MRQNLFRDAISLAALTMCLAGGAADAASQQSASTERVVRSAVVMRTHEPILVDGVLDEAGWSAAPKIGDLIQREPVPGGAPTERTDVMLLHDEDNLYIGIVAYDSAPQRVIGTVMARDASLSSDDRIEILLDTYRDQRSAFYFATNPAGAYVDGLVSGDAQLNTDWDAIWEVRTTRTEQGWVAEFAIPFKSLSFPADRTIWGFNVARYIRRRSEDARWSGAELQTEFQQVSEAGEITFFERLSQGIGVDVRPFIAGNWLHVRHARTDAYNGKPGLDLFYNITPNLKLTATVNTDFGETEVDARQINLSRFSLFFPEKRAFFLEGAGVFRFASSLGPQPAGGVAGTGADVYPFFSRQIGLLAGQEVPLDAGIKLAGTFGRTDIGVLDVRSGDLPGVSEKNFFVGRVKRNLFEQSYVGLLFTEGQPALDRSAQTYAVDMRLATSRFLGGPRNFVVNVYGARSINEGTPGKDWSYGFSAEYPNDKYEAQFVMRDIQENFQPALGFVQRSNVRLLRAAASYNPRPEKFLNILQMFHDVYFTRFVRLDNHQVESWDLYIQGLDWHFRSGDALHDSLGINPIYERLFEPFEISPGVVLPPGEYRFTRIRALTIMTASHRRISGSVGLQLGNYWSGEGELITTSLTYRLPPKFAVSLSTNQTFARLPQGDFTARIVTSNVNYSHSPLLSFSNLIQYDNRSRSLGWQSRVRWTLRPGDDLFVSFQQGWIHEETGTLRFRAEDTKLSAKFHYSFRF